MSKPAPTKNITKNNMEISPFLSSERREIYKVRRIGNHALESAYKIVQELGSSGIEEFRENQYGDIALKADVEAESVILDILRKNKLKIKVVSEEHGITVIGNNPAYLGILDGLDGSSVYGKERTTGRYGTMFAVYSGVDPTYDDYLYGGIMEHVSKKLYFATKEGGSWVVENGKKKRLYCSGITQLDAKSKLYADTNFDEVFKTDIISGFIDRLKSFNIRCLKSSAIHYADLFSGVVDGVIESTRKGNLEIAIAFPLVKEAGGVMIDGSGQSLVGKKYNNFGQEDHLIIVSAATDSLAKNIIKKAFS